MKTKEEIEQLAKDKYNDVYYPYARQGFKEGYTQCQEDMAEKYTEQDMIKFAFDNYYQEDMAKKYTEEDMKKAISLLEKEIERKKEEHYRCNKSGGGVMANEYSEERKFKIKIYEEVLELLKK